MNSVNSVNLWSCAHPLPLATVRSVSFLQSQAWSYHFVNQHAPLVLLLDEAAHGRMSLCVGLGHPCHPIQHPNYPGIHVHFHLSLLMMLVATHHLDHLTTLRNCPRCRHC